MALELVKLDSGTLPAIANAIREKTGDTALLLPSQMAGAINGIQTGVTLPELTKPAAVSDVLEGKEYIGADGEKRTGTLVDQIYEVETIMGSGGISLEVESTAGASKVFAFPEPNLQPENIVAGSSIFGVSGTAKKQHVETGTITPAEDTTTLTIPCSDAPKYAVIYSMSETMNSNDMLGAIINNTGRTELFRGNCFLSYYYSNKLGLSVAVAAIEHGIILPEVASSVFYRAGVDYTWVAYYWEDDV